jgi:hypothetical protein
VQRRQVRIRSGCRSQQHTGHRDVLERRSKRSDEIGIADERLDAGGCDLRSAVRIAGGPADGVTLGAQLAGQ